MVGDVSSVNTSLLKLCIRLGVRWPCVHRSALQLLNPLRDALASASSSEGDHVVEEEEDRLLLSQTCWHTPSQKYLFFVFQDVLRPVLYQTKPSNINKSDGWWRKEGQYLLSKHTHFHVIPFHNFYLTYRSWLSKREFVTLVIFNTCSVWFFRIILLVHVHLPLISLNVMISYFID